jgi:murein peptide amidase A
MLNHALSLLMTMFTLLASGSSPAGDRKLVAAVNEPAKSAPAPAAPKTLPPPPPKTAPAPAPKAAPPPAPQAGATVLGRSVKGKAIKGYYFNRSERAPVLVFANIHGDEDAPRELSRQLEQRWSADPGVLGGVYVIFIPCANPDGVELHTRQNANRVDVNRNFPAGWKPSAPGSATYSGAAPLDQPEAKLLHGLVEKEKPAVVISIHSCRNCNGVNNYDGPAEAFARKMSEANGYKASAEWTAPTPGSFGTWAGKDKQIPTLTLEMPDEIKPGDYAKNVAAVEAVIKLKAAP